MVKFRRKAEKLQRKRRPVDLAQRATKRLEISPPEGVALRLDIAGLGARLGAQVIDSILLTLAAVLISLSLFFAGHWSEQALEAALTFVNLLAGLPYYVACELLMNGRTFGKKMLGIRVVSRDGNGLTTQSVVVRNLMKQAEFSIPIAVSLQGEPVSAIAALMWLCFVLIVPWRSKTNQRLGDMAAGTAVILQPQAVLLPDVAASRNSATAERFIFTSTQLDLYGAYELQVLEGLLQVTGRLEAEGRSDAAHLMSLRQVGAKIRSKIAYAEAIDAVDEKQFLQAFYTAQRAYLEQKKLFGEERADKFHRHERDAELKTALDRLSAKNTAVSKAE